MIKTTIQNRLFRIVTQKKNFNIVVPNRIFKITANKKTYTVNPVGRVFKVIQNNRVFTINAPNKVSLYAQSTKGDKGDKGDAGDDGHSLLYDWDGTQLGIKLDNESAYTYTDLKGDDGGLDYANMTLDTSPEDVDVVPVNGTRNSVLSQLKISLANIKSYVLGTLFNTSSGHDHDGTDSKQIAYTNVTGTPTIPTVPSFETSASNIKADGTASVGSLSTIPRADHVHPDGDSGWIDITSFQNGWQVYTPWNGFVKYRKIGKIGVLNIYNLYNTSNLSAHAGSILTIPAGYRCYGEMFGISVAPASGVKSVLRFYNGTLENDSAYTANDKLELMLFYLIDS